MDSLPLAIRPLVKRLEDHPDLTRSDLVSIVFVVRLVDAMHSCFYLTGLSLSYVEVLSAKLGIPGDLDAEMEVSAIRWSWRKGTVTVLHRIGWDFDGHGMNALSKIASGILTDDISPEEGLRLIEVYESGRDFTQFELSYRNFPGRALAVPLLAASSSAVYFQGTWPDLGFAAAAGGAAGGMHWFASIQTTPHFAHAQDIAVAMVTAMISIMSITVVPDSTCFSAQVLGTLFWFYYGVAFVTSLCEITNNQLITGLSRFFLSVVNSYLLAFGVVLGVWIAAYGGVDRDRDIFRACSDANSQIADEWFVLFMPLTGIGALMQMRVAPRHWPVCMCVQVVAYGSQYLLDAVWKQPVFISNAIPTLLASLAAHVFLAVSHRLKLSKLKVPKNSYRASLPDRGSSTGSAAAEVECSRETDHRFVDKGWADEGHDEGGYLRYDRIQYQRSDHWFCLLPALYLLVPGSGVFKQAFFSIVLAGSESAEDLVLGGVSLVSGIFVIGLSQVMGIRLATAILWLCSETWYFVR